MIKSVSLQAFERLASSTAQLQQIFPPFDSSGQDGNTVSSPTIGWFWIQVVSEGRMAVFCSEEAPLPEKDRTGSPYA